jgi:sugar (pentulose or hexulose) kinase
MNYLSIDIGTTGCKCQLFSEKGEILQYLFEEYDFLASDGCQYVDIYAIEKHLRQMIGSISQQHKIDSVCISSLGESFVLLDKEDNVLFYPMLYTDARGEKEAGEIFPRTFYVKYLLCDEKRFIMIVVANIGEDGLIALRRKRLDGKVYKG